MTVVPTSFSSHNWEYKFHRIDLIFSKSLVNKFMASDRYKQNILFCGTETTEKTLLWELVSSNNINFFFLGNFIFLFME